MTIPREDLYAAIRAVTDFPEEPEPRTVAVAVLKSAADSFRTRAEHVIAARRKGWKGESEALAAVGNGIVEFAVALTEFELPGAADTEPEAIVTAGTPDDAELFPGQCASTSAGERCSLPGGPPPHTGVHVGVRGGKWPQIDAERADRELAELLTTPAPGARKQIVASGDGYEIVATAAAAVAVLERPADYCAQCDTDAHICPGSGEPTAHDGSHSCTHPECSFYNPPAPPVADQFAKDASMTSPTTPAAPSHGFDFVTTAPPAMASASMPQRVAIDLFAPPGGAPKQEQSYSSMKTMATCGLQYRMRYRDGVAESEAPAWWNVGGTAVHETIRSVERANANGTAFDISRPAQQWEAAAAELFKAELRNQIDREAAKSGVEPGRWRAADKGKENEAWWWSKGEDMVRRYLAHREGFLSEGWQLMRGPDGQLVQEYNFHVQLGGVPVQGYVDDAWYNPRTNAFRIRDAKSGSTAPDPFQLDVFGTAFDTLGATGGATLDAVFYDARKGELSTPRPIGPRAAQVVAYRAQQTQAADRAGVFLPNPNTAFGGACGLCPFKRVCPAVAS